MPRRLLLTDVVVEHLEELAFLWSQRLAALRSPDWPIDRFRRLDDRIEAHVQGILAADSLAVDFLAKKLATGEDGERFAAAYALLRLDADAHAPRVLAAFDEAEGESLVELTQALACVSNSVVTTHLKKHYAVKEATARLAGAAEVLAVHGTKGLSTIPLELLLAHDEPTFRRAGWRTVLHLGMVRPREEIMKASADPAVGTLALESAAWARQPWIADACRDARHPAALLFLGILARPVDVPRLVEIVADSSLGLARFDAAAASGHPRVAEALLPHLADETPRVAVAAMNAFTRITGLDVESDRRVQLTPEDGSEPGEFDREFLDEVKLPDPRLAAEAWKQNEPAFAKGTRWSRGLDLSKPPSPQVLAELDMAARWHAILRARVDGLIDETLPRDLECFPLAADPQLETRASSSTRR